VPFELEVLYYFFRKDSTRRRALCTNGITQTQMVTLCCNPIRVAQPLFLLFLVVSSEMLKIYYDFALLKSVQNNSTSNNAPHHVSSGGTVPSFPYSPSPESPLHFSPKGFHLNCGEWCRHSRPAKSANWTSNLSNARWRHFRNKQKTSTAGFHVPDYAHFIMPEAFPPLPKLPLSPKPPFDDILCGTLDMKTLKKMAPPNLYATIQPIYEEQAFQPLLHPPPKAQKVPSSSISWKELRSFIKAGFAAPLFCVSSILVCLSSLFGVLKSNGLRRPILNPSINSHMDWIQKLSLPSPKDILTEAFSHSHACLLDFKGWFCQIPIPQWLKPAFAFKMGKRVFTLCVLPQGWKAAPSIAQAISLIITSSIPNTLVWIDNLLLLGSMADLSKNHSALLRIAKRVGAVFKSTLFLPCTLFTYVGIQIDLEERSWRLDPQWTRKVSPRLNKIISGPHSQPIASWWYLCGCSLWAARVFLVPSSMLGPARAFMSRISHELALNKASLATYVTIDHAALANLTWMVHKIAANAWQKWVVPTKLRVGMSDSSIVGAAFLSSSVSCIWKWPAIFCPRWMYTLEFMALYLGVVSVMVRSPNSLILWYTDNKSAMYTANKLTSADPFVDLMCVSLHMMLTFYKCSLVVRHVPSDSCLPDKFTRLGSLPRDHQYFISVTNSLNGSPNKLRKPGASAEHELTVMAPVGPSKQTNFLASQAPTPLELGASEEHELTVMASAGVRAHEIVSFAGPCCNDHGIQNIGQEICGCEWGPWNAKIPGQQFQQLTCSSDFAFLNF